MIKRVRQENTAAAEQTRRITLCTESDLLLQVLLERDEVLGEILIDVSYWHFDFATRIVPIPFGYAPDMSHQLRHFL